MIDMAGQLICLPDGRQLVRKLGRLKEDQVQKYRDWLETIERKLDVTFTERENGFQSVLSGSGMP